MAFNYGARIKKLMESRELNQVELAKKMRVTPAFVNQLILGRRIAGRRTLFKVANALEIDVSDLLPESIRGGVPLLFDVSGRTHCEFMPEDWGTADTKPPLVPLPTGYSTKLAESSRVFAVAIKGNRFYPSLKDGMTVYLKPVKPSNFGIDNYNILCLYRDNEGWCTFEEVEFKQDGMFILKDLLTGNTMVYNKKLTNLEGSLYQVVSISVN